jgi:hypothetical protein
VNGACCSNAGGCTNGVSSTCGSEAVGNVNVGGGCIRNGRHTATVSSKGGETWHMGLLSGAGCWEVCTCVTEAK